MNQNLLLLTVVPITLLTACQPYNDKQVVTNLTVADIPQEVTAVISERRADFVPEEVQKKVRGKRVYYDIEGESAGSEIEFDVLMTKDGPVIVETQRDLAWSELPQDIRTTYQRDVKAAKPVRIIESVQTDNSIVYEFFLKEKPKDPSFEIFSEKGSKPKLLNERSEH